MQVSARIRTVNAIRAEKGVKLLIWMNCVTKILGSESAKIRYRF